MIKLSWLMRRLPHLSREQFQTYWREQHPNAVPHEGIGALGIKRYIQVHTLGEDLREIVVGPREGLVEPFDGIAELWIESEEALRRDWTAESARPYLEAFIADEANFIDWSRSTILVSREIVMMG